MLKGGEKHFFCIWLKIGIILSVKPVNDFACEGFCKFAVDKGVINGVWLTTVDAVAVCIYPISEELFLFIFYFVIVFIFLLHFVKNRSRFHA